MSEVQRLVAELRPYIADDRVLAAIAAVPREAFVPPELRPQAYDNTALGIGCGQTISQPLVVARMTELLELHPEDRVLDVGTGSGYHAAVLAALGGQVWSVERHPELSASAERALAEAGIEGVEGLALARRRDVDRVERRLLGQAARAVADDQGDVVDAGEPQRLARLA